jgi:chemotaxis protein methyltransferase CheR
LALSLGGNILTKPERQKNKTKGATATGSSIDLEDLEIELLLSAIYKYYGLDFRNYADGSIRRRIWKQIEQEKLFSISQLQNKILHDKRCMERFLLTLSINVTSMFRDPPFYRAFRKKIVPLLKTYPSIRVWCAGCSTGEEVYSLAILLHEEGLFEKSRIYATDMNEAVLRTAQEGIYPLLQMQEYTKNYVDAKGKHGFSEYYTAKYESAILRPFLKEKIVFAKHNLASENSFNEFNVIFCRNVLIYFNEDLQKRVHQLMYESLCRFGILCLGEKESISFTGFEKDYEELDPSYKIYKRLN